MTSGRKLTQEETDKILELVALQDNDGGFRLSLSCIANQVGVHRRTVYSVIRSAAAKWGMHTRWKSDEPS